MPIRILIADDHPVVRSGLKAILASQPDFEFVAEAENGAVAVNLARQCRPDVVLMDLQMPVMDGVSAIDHLQTLSP
ncbi:MAG TPA: response regulator transcription factor, partial [Anaerolineales bacterium]|nr:response regulator transcription factor [Anaerolineales bacterium]